VESQVQQDKRDSRIQDFQEWFNIKELSGWLIYTKELEEKISYYDIMLNNVELDAQMLKNCQLIRKGLKMALDIPRILENKAKLAKRGA